MNNRLYWLWTGLAVVAGAAGPACDAPGGSGADAQPQRLQVALYPYVPRLEQFERILRESWTRTDIELEIVDWNGYDEDPPDDLDVFAFDAIYLDYFHAQGYLAPIPEERIANPQDFVPYAIDGSRIDGQLYAVPQLGCATLLFYREGDTELAAASSLDDIATAVGECSYATEAPPPDTGLMLDLSSSTITASYYVEAIEDLAQSYTPMPELPPPDQLDPQAMAQVVDLASLASAAHGSYYNPEQPWQRAVWFGEGRGRAMVGFTESLSLMGPARESVRMKPLPMAGTPDVHLFYADLVGINSKLTDPVLVDAALELADLLASTEYIAASFGPDPAVAGSVPQYILPARMSVFDALGAGFPLYERMRALVTTTEPRLFRMGPSSRPWLAQYRRAISDRILAESRCQ